MKKLIIGSIVVLFVTGCASQLHRSEIRDGMLRVGLSRYAFVNEWGNPTRTRVIPGDSVTRAGWSMYGGGFYKGKTYLEEWTYEDRDTQLLFNRDKLVNWRTNKTVEELKKND